MLGGKSSHIELSVLPKSVSASTHRGVCHTLIVWIGHVLSNRSPPSFAVVFNN